MLQINVILDEVRLMKGFHPILIKIINCYNDYIV